MRYLIIDVALAATMTSLFIVALAAVVPGFRRQERTSAQRPGLFLAVGAATVRPFKVDRD
jgi:hypothetical protein